MCRLLGWATHRPTSLLDLLGQQDLDDFTELSCKHADGWGLATAGTTGIDVHKEPDAARMSDRFAAWSAAGVSDLGMVHLRWATLGLEVRPENTHPFTAGRFAFAHNGSIAPPESVDRLVAPDLAPLRRGDTDSERYFLAVLSRVLEGATPAEALADTVGRLVDAGGLTSLNCLLLTPDELYAVCRFDPECRPHDDEGDDYFQLRYRATDDAVVVASTGWGSDWAELGNGELLTVRRGTLATSVVSLDGALAR